MKMRSFNHPNVMSLMGVCLDAGPAPFIVLPFMSGGDLLSYVKQRRSFLVVEYDGEDESVSEAILQNDVVNQHFKKWAMSAISTYPLLIVS